MSAGGFRQRDFDLLREIGEGAGGGAHGEDADALWTRARALSDSLAHRLLGGGANTEVWGEHDPAQRGPFLWIRLKRTSATAFATHIGIFLSPGLCNLSIDLEKDPLDAGEAGETLDQFIDFFRDDAVALIDPPARPDLQVWTDTGNVAPAKGFAAVDFGGFMDANRDAGHPWPKAGYLMRADEVVGFGDGWVAEYHDRALVLLPVYDAMIRSYARQEQT